MILRSAAVAALMLVTSGAAVALNPQPEPPGVMHVSGIVLVALNPQPEPPGVTAAGGAHVTGARVMLNPQPEPPGIVDARRLLPPGPCKSVLVSVAAPGAPAVTTHAVATRIAGRCSFDAAVPGARSGSTATITVTRGN